MKNAILISRIDKEDYWVTGGLVFKVNNTTLYESAYNEIKHLLESNEIINYVIEENCLECDLFDEDATYIFKETSLSYGAICFTFINSDGETVDFKMSVNFVYRCN